MHARPTHSTASRETFSNTGDLSVNDTVARLVVSVKLIIMEQTSGL